MLWNVHMISYVWHVLCFLFSLQPPPVSTTVDGWIPALSKDGWNPINNGMCTTYQLVRWTMVNQLKTKKQREVDLDIPTVMAHPQ